MTNFITLIERNKLKYYSSLIAMLGILFLLIYSCEKKQDKVLEARPNVVIIFMDDLGYGDLEDYGATGYETPHLNKLADEGIRFTNFYAAQAVCSASRAGLLTGCYPNRIGIHGALFPGADYGLNPNETTIAEISV